MNNTFDPEILSEDLLEARRIYARYFDRIKFFDWDGPAKGSPEEWNLHETIAHLVALNKAGLESIQYALKGEQYIFLGLENRFKFNEYNRKGIDEYRIVPRQGLCAEVLNILEEGANIARNLNSKQASLTVKLPIYNRPVSIVEGLSIIIFHIGLVHSAQVAEPAGLPPLWKQFSPGFSHRVVERFARALSLLYRFDIGGRLNAAFVFKIRGMNGGEWFVDVSPEGTISGEGTRDKPGLVIRFADLGILFQMVTGRLNILLSLLTGRLMISGKYPLFFKFVSLFSVDAKPKMVERNVIVEYSNETVLESEN